MIGMPSLMLTRLDRKLSNVAVVRLTVFASKPADLAAFIGKPNQWKIGTSRPAAPRPERAK